MPSSSPLKSLVARKLGMSLFLLRVVIGEYGAMWSHMNLSMAQIFDMTEAAVGCGLFEAYSL